MARVVSSAYLNSVFDKYNEEWDIVKALFKSIVPEPDIMQDTLSTFLKEIPTELSEWSGSLLGEAERIKSLTQDLEDYSYEEERTVSERTLIRVYQNFINLERLLRQLSELMASIAGSSAAASQKAKELERFV